MSVGVPNSKGNVDGQISNAAIQMRNLMQVITNLSITVNGQGNGITYLESIGYGSTANTSNPGNVSDAQFASSMIAYLNTVAGVYYGTVQQGGTGGTAATTFNFNNELSQMWGGN